jgi:hypothetical protein
MPYKPRPAPAPTIASPFLDAPSAAVYLRVSAMWLAKLRTVGGGPVFSKLNGGKIIYNIDDLISWVESQRVQNTSQVQYAGRRRGRPRKVANGGEPAAPLPPQTAPEPEPQSRPRKPIVDFKLEA